VPGSKTAATVVGFSRSTSVFHLCKSVANRIHLRCYLRYLRDLRLSFVLHDSAHQRNKPAAGGDFQFVEDPVNMLFHHRQTQASVISDLLITPPFADKSRNFLLAPGESGKMGQTGARRPGTRSRAQIFAFDKKMRPRHAS
jgi:hypothetical protein